MSKAFVRALESRGHTVEVIAAHPHYPSPRWGRRWRPYREVRDGVRVLRLPLWIGRASAAQRVRQELSFMAALMSAMPFIRRPDVSLVVSPSFPALLPAIISHKIRRVPWALWLHDVLPDGATATGIVDDGSLMIRLARRLERAAYRTCNRIAVISSAFIPNLEAKGVKPTKIELISLPATRAPHRLGTDRPARKPGPLRVLSMGNIGFSQNLAAVVRAWEASDVEAELRITGTGVALEDVQSEVHTDRVRMLGLLADDALEQELLNADIALVSQNAEGVEFNMPSKLMNFMTYGLPVIAVVNPNREVARVIDESGGGWVVSADSPEEFPQLVEKLQDHRDELVKRGEASLAYAEDHFSQAGFAARLDALVRGIVRD